MPGGRPSELTTKTQRTICKALAAGHVREHAARAGGISSATFHRWMRVGRKARTGKYRQFFTAVEAAEAKALEAYVATIRKAGTGYTEKTVKERKDASGGTSSETVTRRMFDPDTARWWLRVRFPQHYGDQTAEIKALKKQLADLEAIIRGHGHAATTPATNGPAPGGSPAPGGTTGPADVG